MSEIDPSTASEQPSPEEPIPQMTADQLREAQEYGRWGLGCSLADRLLDIVFLSGMAWWGVWPLIAWLNGSATLQANRSLLLLSLAICLYLLHAAISLPLSYFSGHVLEHRYGLSTLKLGGWFWRYSKHHALGLGFSLILYLGLYWLIWWIGSGWWLAAAGAFFLVSVLLGQLAPVCILPLFYKVDRLDRPELQERINRVVAGTGLSIEGVYRLGLSSETTKANAMLAGLGRTRRVLLGDTLLDRFSDDEIEVILGHEVGHHVHRHLGKMLLLGVFVSGVGFWICDLLLQQYVALWDGPTGYAELPVWTLPFLTLCLTLFGQLLEPIQNILSRRFERQSDRYALQATGLTQAYRSAFQKLAILNKSDPHPPWLEVFLFHSHPPIAERLAAAAEHSES